MHACMHTRILVECIPVISHGPQREETEYLNEDGSLSARGTCVVSGYIIAATAAMPMKNVRLETHMDTSSARWMA
jgi:hypothetical protein